jgi:hypothetical protein
MVARQDVWRVSAGWSMPCPALGADRLAAGGLVGHPTILPREGSLVGEGHRHRAVDPISPWSTSNGVPRSVSQARLTDRDATPRPPTDPYKNWISRLLDTPPG